MSRVRLSRVSFAYAGGSDVLTDISASFDSGFTGVVGENGGGKTTLLRLIAGELAPTCGEISVVAEVSDRLLCRQRVEVAQPELVRFAGRFDREALRWQSRLGVQGLDVADFATLSPGERKRWQLAWALARDPEVLLLDEPSNHLDTAGRKLLLSVLASYRGVGVVVSHDRELLDGLCARTMRIEARAASVLPLGYSQAREQWGADLDRQRAVHSDLRSQLRKSERHRSRLRDQRARAQRSIGAGTRIKGPRDSDARSANARGRAEAGEAALAQRLSAASSRAERAAAQLGETRVTKAKGTSVAFKGELDVRRRLAGYEGDLVVGGRLLATDVRLQVLRDTRIHVWGDNGVGKTTLLLQLVDGLGDSCLYVPQFLGADHERRLRRTIERSSSDQLGEIMTLAAALGVDPDRALSSQAFSPGQLRKLVIAFGLAREASLLVLDEPTNHLDLPSIERLEEALDSYPAALVIVTHDHLFAAALGLESWRLTRHGLRSEDVGDCG